MKKIDIKRHVLVPKHVKLSEKEKTSLLEKYDISIKQLPKILKNDPAIKELNAKPGDITKVIRQSPTAGETVFYREVINE